MSNYLEHKGTKGMKWGYNDGKRNGKRIANSNEETPNKVSAYDLKSPYDSLSKYNWSEGVNLIEWLKSTQLYGCLVTDETVAQSIERGVTYCKTHNMQLSIGASGIAKR